jgi:hypothetical protein
MYARLLALVCLFIVTASVGRTEVPDSVESELEVYLKEDQNASPGMLGVMSEELKPLMRFAGFRLQVRNASEPPSTVGAEHLVVVELRGTCAVDASRQSHGPLRTPLALASSSVVDGKVLPFTSIDCSALSRFLSPAIAKKSHREQNHLYGRAMARVLAHEFYHVLAQTEEHTPTGIAKARFSINDLLADHLDFEAIAMDRIHVDRIHLDRLHADRLNVDRPEPTGGGASAAGR